LGDRRFTLAVRPRAGAYAGGPTWPAGRHHRHLAVARICRQVLPFLPLMRDADQQAARPSVMNILPAGLVLSDMRIHRQNGPSSAPAGRQDNMTDAPAGRLRWRPRRRRDRGNARCAPGSGAAGNQTAPGDQTAAVRAAPGETVAAAMQLAIAVLTAGLDSPELEAWVADGLTPVDADGLGDFMAGLHVVSVLLLLELHEATGEPSAAILQRLAILAEHGRGTPSAG
jgi:hypothetical protein